MGIVYIQNRVFARYVSHYTIRELKDCLDVKFTPQESTGGLKPEFSFCFSNSQDRLFLVHVALASNGKYYFGYNIHLDLSGMGANPGMNIKYMPGYNSLMSCLIGALHYCATLSLHHNTPPDIRLVKDANIALHEVNKLRLRQMTIFDVL